jgi:hypothetical protein
MCGEKQKSIIKTAKHNGNEDVFIFLPHSDCRIATFRKYGRVFESIGPCSSAAPRESHTAPQRMSLRGRNQFGSLVLFRPRQRPEFYPEPRERWYC